MAAKKIYDAVAVTGEYKDSQGQTRKAFKNVGSVLQDGEGRMSLKLETLPVGEWSGWVNFYPLKEPDNRAPGFDKGLTNQVH